MDLIGTGHRRALSVVPAEHERLDRRDCRVETRGDRQRTLRRGLKAIYAMGRYHREVTPPIPNPRYSSRWGLPLPAAVSGLRAERRALVHPRFAHHLHHPPARSGHAGAGRAASRLPPAGAARAPRDDVERPVSRPRDSRHNSRAGHPGWRRCSSLTNSRFCALLAPGHPGTALRDLRHESRGRDTTVAFSASGRWRPRTPSARARHRRADRGGGTPATAGSAVRDSRGRARSPAQAI